jgi:CspA family cold shock protein
MAIGKVKWFNNAKGYGFILPDDGGDDLFAHYSSVQMDGYKTLKAGQEVQFEIIEGPKGLQATDIQEAEGAEDTAERADDTAERAEDGAEVAEDAAEVVADASEISAESVAAEVLDEGPETSEVLSVTVEDATPSVELSDTPPDQLEEASKASHSN